MVGERETERERERESERSERWGEIKRTSEWLAVQRTWSNENTQKYNGAFSEYVKLLTIASNEEIPWRAGVKLCICPSKIQGATVSSCFANVNDGRRPFNVIYVVNATEIKW